MPINNKYIFSVPNISKHSGRISNIAKYISTINADATLTLTNDLLFLFFNDIRTPIKKNKPAIKFNNNFIFITSLYVTIIQE